MEQPSRPLILDTMAELRKAGGAPDRPGLGRWALSVPFEDWVRLREKYPDLASTDAKVKSRAWLKLIASPEAAPFKVRDRV
jgi:hypothetical protein